MLVVTMKIRVVSVNTLARFTVLVANAVLDFMHLPVVNGRSSTVLIYRHVNNLYNSIQVEVVVVGG